MPASEKVNINVQGNFSGNIIIGDNNIVYGNEHGAQVNKISEKQKATFDPRTRPINLRPRAFPNLLSRTTEIENIKKALANATPVTLFGENGIGKTSLLRQSAHLDETEKFKDGVIYLLSDGEERDDLLQQIFDTFYVSSENQKPTDAQLRDSLKNTQALIILDDLTLKREDATFLLDAVPNSTFIFASIERSLWGEGQVIGLDGLPEKEALQLFERELGREIKADEKEYAAQICKILLYHPLRILQTASMIREDGLSIPEAFTSLTKTRTQSPVLEATLNKTNETQKKILSLLAVAGGFALTREHLSKLAGSLNFDSEMKPLLARGFVEAQGASFTLSSEAVASLSRMWDLSNWEDALINHFSGWLQTAPQDMLVDQVANTLFHLIQRAGEKKQWKHVARIGRRLEQIYALKKKWEGWLKILNLLRLAANALKDKFLEGWALHQLGSRAMGLGINAEAQELLNQALKIRKTIGDKPGMQVTQHNLNMLTNVPVLNQSITQQASLLKKMLLIGGIGSVVIAIIVLIVAGGLIVFSVLPDSTSTPLRQTTIAPATSTTVAINTPTPTPTRNPTRTPTSTPTATPRPVVLFDFVANADEAIWEFTTSLGSIDEITTPIAFSELFTDSVSPEYYSSNFAPYVGWQAKPTLEDNSAENRVLLNYPHQSEARIRGIYNFQKFPLQKGDIFQARVGHAYLGDGFPDSPFSVIFMVKFYQADPNLFPKTFALIAEQEDFYDGKTHDIKFTIPAGLYEKTGWFVLEVYSGETSTYDWAVWMDAVLLGLPR